MTLPHFLKSDKSYQPTPAITPPFNETLESMQLKYPPFSHMVCTFLVDCSWVFCDYVCSAFAPLVLLKSRRMQANKVSENDS